ncbi:unnamed protein product, partial [Effrenium voratum]
AQMWRRPWRSTSALRAKGPARRACACICCGPYNPGSWRSGVSGGRWTWVRCTGRDWAG